MSRLKPLTVSEASTRPFTSLPPNAFFVHSCNCLGEWGPVVAAQLRRDFPAAFEVYRSFCEEHKRAGAQWPTTSRLTGRCLIIPPQESDTSLGRPHIYIVCLFTSAGYGRGNANTGKPGKDAPDTILQHTWLALKDFHDQITENASKAGLVIDAKDTTIYCPKFNAGNFGVPWESSLALIREAFKGWQGQWIVLTQP